MWRRSRVLLRKGPRSLEGLPTPNVSRRWGDFRQLKVEERAEWTEGAWREANPIQLVETHQNIKLEFPSDEAAEKYLKEEEEDNLAEQPIPTLALAQEFYTDLATSADEELEPGADSEPLTDEEREEEGLDVNRHFFGDYYLQQGICPAELKFAFIDAMLRPAAALFQVNECVPLVRLAVRDQLEVHARSHGVLQPTPLSPTVFAVEMVPTQPLGAVERLPYTAERSVIEQRSSQAELLDDGGPSADSLFDLLDDSAETPILPTPLPEAEEVESPPPAAPSSVLPPPRPPSLSHLYWLQRQVASRALLPVDVLSCLLTMLVPRLAVRECREGEVPMIVDLSRFTGGASSGNLLYPDLCQHCLSQEDPLRTVTVVSASSPSPRENEEEEEESFPNLIQWRPKSGSLSRLLRSLPLRPHAILLAPETSQDGQRPKLLDERDIDRKKLIPNRYIEVCVEVNRRFDRLRSHLLDTLHAAMEREGGWVVYATYSMNPIENEAVVCSVLTDWAESYPNRARVRPVPLTADVLRSALTPEENEVLGFYLGMGEGGKEKWNGIEGGSEAMDCGYNTTELVKEVVAAAWRVTPFTAPQCEGMFLCVLRVEGMYTVSTPVDLSDVPTGVTVSSPASPRGRLWAMNSSTALLLEGLQRVSPRPHAGLCAGYRMGNTVYYSPTAAATPSVLTTLQRDQTLKELTVPMALLADLLLVGGCSSLSIQRVLGAGDEETSTVLQEFYTLLVQTIRSQADDSVQCIPLVLRPVPPSLPSDMSLHPMVAEELARVGVVAHLRVRHTSSNVSFVLQLTPPEELPDYEKEAKWFAESSVSTRDALLYILRRLGKPATPYFSYSVDTPEEVYESERIPSSEAFSSTGDDTLQEHLFHQQQEATSQMKATLDAISGRAGGSPNDWVEERRGRHRRRW